MFDFNGYKGFRELMSLGDKYNPIEGNIGKYPKKMIFYINLISSMKPKVILEVGFNSGISCCLALNNIASDSFVYSLDLGEHDYCEPAMAILKKYFSNFHIIFGDSKKTLKDFLAKNIFFDLCFIDGGHDTETCKNDIECCILRLKPNGIILIDDMKLRSVRRAVKCFKWDRFDKIPIIGVERPMIGYKKTEVISI